MIRRYFSIISFTFSVFLLFTPNYTFGAEHTPNEYERTAADWMVLAFHACAQAERGDPPDFAQGFERQLGGLSEIHEPAPKEIVEGFSPLEIIRGTSGVLALRSTHTEHANALVTYNERKKAIIVAFRGTQFWSERINNYNAGLKQSETLKALGFDGFLHAGYVNLFESLVDQVRKVIAGILSEHPDAQDWDIIVTGHSLGGALSSLVAPYLSRLESIQNPVHLVTFGAPYVGFRDFSDWVRTSEHMRTMTAFIRATDIAPMAVAQVIGIRRIAFPGDSWWPRWLPEQGDRTHVGNLVVLPSFGKSRINFPDAHSVRHYRWALYLAEEQFNPLFRIKTRGGLTGWLLRGRELNEFHRETYTGPQRVSLLPEFRFRELVAAATFWFWNREVAETSSH